jgi:hypothetical protein
MMLLYNNAPACCCQNASNASRVWLGSFERPAYSPVYDKGKQKLITHSDNCLNVGGDYVEKYLRVCNNDTLNLFLFCSFFFIAKRSLLSGRPS